MGKFTFKLRLTDPTQDYASATITTIEALYEDGGGSRLDKPWTRNLNELRKSVGNNSPLYVNVKSHFAGAPFQLMDAVDWHSSNHTTQKRWAGVIWKYKQHVVSRKVGLTNRHELSQTGDLVGQRFIWSAIIRRRWSLSVPTLGSRFGIQRPYGRTHGFAIIHIEFANPSSIQIGILGQDPIATNTHLRGDNVGGVNGVGGCWEEHHRGVVVALQHVGTCRLYLGYAVFAQGVLSIGEE